MRGLALLTLLAAGGLVSMGISQEDARKEAERLQGVWQRVSGEVDGKAVPADELAKTTLTIRGDQYTLQMGTQTRKGTLRVNPATKPRSLELISAEGPNKGKSLLGIYELDGDTFRYCVAAPGKERPASFTSTPGSGQGLYVNKRVKP